ncbi:hypothetical protein RYX36_003722, partial [Vicia faba]
RVLTENKKSVSNLIGQKLNAFVNKGFKPSQHDNQVDDADNGTLSIKPLRTTLPPPPMSKGVSSQLFKEKGAVSKAKTKTRPVKEVSSHKRKTRSETKSFHTPDRVMPEGFAAGPNYEYSLHHSVGWPD